MLRVHVSAETTEKLLRFVRREVNTVVFADLRGERFCLTHGNKSGHVCAGEQTAKTHTVICCYPNECRANGYNVAPELTHDGETTVVVCDGTLIAF